MRTKLRAPAAVALALLLVGCAAKNPNSVPTPPPIQFATDLNKLAQLTNTAATALVAARDQGKLPQADYAIASKVVRAIATTGNKLVAEGQSADTWDVQKVTMRNIVAESGLPELAKQLPENARAIIELCINTFNSVSSAAGGPVL